MNRATKMLVYTSVAVVGWYVLRYFHGRLLAPAGLAVEQFSVRDRKAYRRAAERWENEGGATLAGRTSEPESRIVELRAPANQCTVESQHGPISS